MGVIVSATIILGAVKHPQTIRFMLATKDFKSVVLGGIGDFVLAITQNFFCYSSGSVLRSP